MSDLVEKLRLDKWLWQARFFKTRSLSAKEISAGHVRVNGDRVSKPAFQVTPGDALTFTQGQQVRVVRIVALGTRRGPVPEAQALYDDLTPVPDPDEIRDNLLSNPRYEGKGRPTKRDRRKLDLNGRGALE